MNFRHAGCCAALVSLVLAASAVADTTVTVSPAGLGPWQSVVSDTHGNFVTDTDATVSWGVNPPGAPLGTGSVTLDTGTNHGDSAPQLVDQALAGTQLAALKTLSYATLGTLIAGPNLQGQLPYLVLTLDLNGDGTEDDSIVFEPIYQHGYRSDLPDQGPIQTGVWQNWDALHGGWWSFSGNLAGAGPGFGIKSLPEILAAAPNATIVQANTIPQGGLRVVIGVRNVPDHLVGSVDDLAIDTGTGVTHYDFEPGTQPQENSSLVLQRVSGNVIVGGQTLSAGSKSIKLGTFIDATHGQVTITSASDTHGSYQTGLFYGGKFKTRQRGTKRPVTEAYLTGPVGPCAKTKSKGKNASASAKRKRRTRHLWGDSHGNFRTVGKSSSASTRGTKWLTKDTCQGTVTTVVRGKVLVRDFVTNGRHIVTAGHSFLAPLP